MEANNQEIYRIVFKDYPDLMDVGEVSKVLGISTKTVYKLIHKDVLQALKIGREFRVPKIVLMKHIKIFGSTPATQTT